MRVGPVLSVVVLLGACGDPLAGVDKLGDVDVVQTDPTAAALPTETEVAREGFFGTRAATGDASVGINAQEPAAAPTESGGFFRKLVRRAADIAPAEASDAVPVELAALPAKDAPAAPAPRGYGLFGSGKTTKSVAPRRGPDARDVPYGTVLAFGQIARVCEAKGKSLGTKVEGTGRRGFSLYDSKAGIRDKRTFYITGFSDNCPRQFTAANALLGAPSFYEEIRFGPAGKHLPYAATDKAYDGVKSSICRVSKKKPCGRQISKLDSTTVFVSAYEFSEHNGSWKEFLVHDGEVLASAAK